MQSQLPPGFRFKPTDEELIHYLQKKVSGEQLPSNAVIEGEVYGENARLPEGNDSVGEKILYILTKRMKNSKKGTKKNRLAGNGFWKVTGNKKMIYDRNQRLIGLKRSLVFKERYETNVAKKNWIMDEYELVPSHENLEEWFLCKIKQSNRSPERPEFQEEATITDLNDDCLIEESPVENAVWPSLLGQVPLSDPSWETLNRSTSTHAVWSSHLSQVPPSDPSWETMNISASNDETDWEKFIDWDHCQ